MKIFDIDEQDFLNPERDKLSQMKFEELTYTPGDVFIFHTKEIEDHIYKEWKLEGAYDMPLIPKGTIARKPPEDLDRYPILSQIKAETKKESRTYLQIANIATPTRYQGSLRRWQYEDF